MVKNIYPVMLAPQNDRRYSPVTVAADRRATHTTDVQSTTHLHHIFSTHQITLKERRQSIYVGFPTPVSKVKYTLICIAHFYAKRLKCAQTWITKFYLQITPCLPLLPSRRTSPLFGWYSFYRPTKGRRLSRPGWLVTYRNKVPPAGVKPGHGHPSQY